MVVVVEMILVVGEVGTAEEGAEAFGDLTGDVGTEDNVVTIFWTGDGGTDEVPPPVFKATGDVGTEAVVLTGEDGTDILPSRKGGGAIVAEGGGGATVAEGGGGCCIWVVGL